MKVHKLLKQIGDFLDAGKRKRRARAESMIPLLRRLKKKERRIQERLRAEREPQARAKLERKKAVVHAQRTKGLRAVRELRKS